MSPFSSPPFACLSWEVPQRAFGGKEELGTSHTLTVYTRLGATFEEDDVPFSERIKARLPSCLFVLILCAAVVPHLQARVYSFLGRRTILGTVACAFGALTNTIATVCAITGIVTGPTRRGNAASILFVKAY